jgi:dihydroorotase
MELYCEVFEREDALDRLEGFASRFGPDFYGLPRNTATVTVEKQPWEVPADYAFGTETVVPLRAGERLAWRFRG